MDIANLNLDQLADKLADRIFDRFQRDPALLQQAQQASKPGAQNTGGTQSQPQHR